MSLPSSIEYTPIESALKLLTHSIELSALTTPHEGCAPTRYAPPTSFVPVAISEIESLSKFETNISPPSGFKARCTGDLPTSRKLSRRSVCSLSIVLAGRANPIANTWCPPEQATKAFDESGRITASVACGQLTNTARTLSFSGSTTETLLLMRFVTTRLLSSGEIFASPGASPTPIAPISRRLSRSITETLFDPELAT